MPIISTGSGRPAITSAVRRPNNATSAGASNAPAPSVTSLSDSITATVREKASVGSSRCSSDSEVASAIAIAAPHAKTSTATTARAGAAPTRPTATPAATNEKMQGSASRERPICAAVNGSTTSAPSPVEACISPTLEIARMQKMQGDHDQQRAP